MPIALTRNLTVNLLLLVGLAILAWYLVLGMGMPAPVGFAQNSLSSWVMRGLMSSPASPEEVWYYLYLSSIMWTIMMIAMMVPAAIPLTILHAANVEGSESRYDTVFLAAGYLLSWVAFGLSCAVLQLIAVRIEIFDGMSMQVSAGVSGAIFIICGVYQFSPLKQSCLRLCNSPLAFMLKEWRTGKMGALVMGLRFGFYCVGCCWAIMLLMFAQGTMSLNAMALICVFILLERLTPGHSMVRILPGASAIAFGLVALYSQAA